MFKLIIICLSITVLGIELANAASLINKRTEINEKSLQRLRRELESEHQVQQQQINQENPNVQASWDSQYPYGYHYNPFMMPHHPNCLHMSYYGSSEEMEGCNMYWSHWDRYNNIQTGDSGTATVTATATPVMTPAVTVPHIPTPPPQTPTYPYYHPYPLYTYPQNPYFWYPPQAPFYPTYPWYPPYMMPSESEMNQNPSTPDTSTADLISTTSSPQMNLVTPSVITIADTQKN